MKAGRNLSQGFQRLRNTIQRNSPTINKRHQLAVSDWFVGEPSQQRAATVNLGADPGTV
jgi:hypothetical protein